MKTKVELLTDNYSKKCVNWNRAFEINPTFIQSVYESMDEYAKQEAIDFAKYCKNEGEGLVPCDTLFELYLQSKPGI